MPSDYHCIRLISYNRTLIIRLYKSIHHIDIKMLFLAATNSTQEPFIKALPTSLVVSLTTAYVITFLIAIPGNALGLFVVYRRRSFRNTMNLLIMNMCLADFLLMIIITPMNFMYIYRSTWIPGLAGDVICKVLQYGFVVTIAASILTILFISCERYFAICYPLKGKLLRRPRVVTAWIWLLSFVMMSPYAVLHKNIYKERPGVWYCTMWIEGEQERHMILRIHYLILFVVLYAFPVVLIAGLNSIIVYRLAFSRMPGESQGASREVAMRFRHKAVKMLIALLTVFALCWLPTHVIHYLMTSQPHILRILPRGVPYFSYWLGHFNSVLNPVIYVLLSDNFRRDFKMLVLGAPKRSKTFSVKATTSVMLSSRERSGSGLGRFSRRLSETLSLKSFPRTPSIRHGSPQECMSMAADNKSDGEEL